MDKVPKKYDGLNGTELAISESQERMAVVISPKDETQFLAYAAEENLEATRVAEVTDSNRVKMTWRGENDRIDVRAGKTLVQRHADVGDGPFLRERCRAVGDTTREAHHLHARCSPEDLDM